MKTRDLPAGSYQGYIVNYDITQTQKGDPQILVLFSFNDKEGDHHELTWYGNLTSEKGRKIALEALVKMGFSGKNVADLAGGLVDSKAPLLDVATPLELVIEREAKKDGSGTYAKIAWVNRQGGNKWVSKGMNPAEARVKLGALNLEGELAAIRAKEPAKPAAKAAGQDFNSYDPAAEEDDSLPF